MGWRHHGFIGCVLISACGTSETKSSDSTGDGAATSTTAQDAAVTTVGGSGSGANSSADTTEGSVSGAGNSAGVTTTGETSTSAGGEPSTSSAAGGAESTSTDGMTGSSTDGSQVDARGTPVEEELAPLPIARSEHGVAALGGEVYVLGGFTPTVTSSVQVYSPEADSWRDAADFPVVFHHPNVAVVGGLLYVLGFHATSAQRVADGSAYAYDPSVDSWSERASMPLGTERGASCVTTFDDKVYVFGGTNDVALVEASVYDPAEDSWQALPPLPIARHHCIAAVYDNQIYIVSGRDVVIEEVQTQSFVFDPVTQVYTEVAPILTPRGGAAGGELGGRIYVFGGEGNVNDPNGIFHEAEEYDPALDTWASLPDMTVPRHGLGAAVIGDRMYLPGGSTAQGIQAQTTNTVFYFEPP